MVSSILFLCLKSQHYKCCSHMTLITLQPFNLFPNKSIFMKLCPSTLHVMILQLSTTIYMAVDWRKMAVLFPLKVEYYTTYGICCHYDNFLDDIPYEWVNWYCHGCWMNSSIGQNPIFFLSATCDENCNGWLKFGWKVIW